MLSTLHRYILGELLRSFAMSIIALTLVINVGLLLPNIKDYGVSPNQIFQMLVYLLPISLTFVLPMSALFSASMVYGRFAADRELDACRASGISLMTTVYPALFLAIVVAMANLLLSFYVAPEFIHQSEKSFKANAQRILFRNLQRKGHYRLPGSNYWVYADSVNQETQTLGGVVIIDRKDGQVKNMFATQAAKVMIESTDQYNLATVIARDTYRFDEMSPVYIKDFSVTSRFPSLLSDKIKFQKIKQIKQIQANKLKFFPIREKAWAMRAQLATELLATDIIHTMAQDDAYYTFEDIEGIVEYKLSVAELKVDPTKPHLLNLIGPIRLIKIDKSRNEVSYVYDSDAGTLTFQNDKPGSIMEMDLQNPTYTIGAGEVQGQSLRTYINDIMYPADLNKQMTQKPLLQMLSSIGQDNSMVAISPSSKLSHLRDDLTQKLSQVSRKIQAEVHSRMVFGLGCVFLILTGTALGILFRGGHMLSAFGASAIPGGILILFILMGKEITKNPQTSAHFGVVLMWLGLGALVGLTVMVYKKLLRT